MVDPFYGGAAHSSSYPPTHCIVASFPSSGDCPLSLWDATGNYFQLPLPAVAQGSSDMENHISGAAPFLCKYDLTSLRLLQQIQMSKFNKPIIPKLGANKQSESFQLKSLFHSRTMDVQSFEFDQTSHRLHSIIHKNVLGVPSLETSRVLEVVLLHTGNPIRIPQGLGLS